MSLEVRGLKKKIGGFELRASLRVGRDERLAISGRSGGGKTSLLRLIAGLEPLEEKPDRFSLGEMDLCAMPAEKRGIGYVFQEQALFPDLTVLENAAFGLRMRGVARAEREAQALGWLGKVGMAGLAGSMIEKLSGGERQRIAVVRSLIWKPSLLLLDEPFSALDRTARQALIRDILALLGERPIPTIIVTHDHSDVESIATRRLEMKEDADGAVRNFVD